MTNPWVKVTADDIKPDTKWSVEHGLDTIGVVERYDWPADSRFADTPYELWTPSHRSGQPTPRFATLTEAVDASQRARTSTLKPYVAHQETYRGTEIVITRHPASLTEYGTLRLSRHSLTLGGKAVTAPTGDLETVVKKMHQRIDLDAADREILPRLTTLVDARQSVEGFPGWDDGAVPAEGDVAYVYAMGRYRRGLVTKVTRTRATVSYTTASSQGRVFHKADKHAELAASA